MRRDSNWGSHAVSSFGRWAILVAILCVQQTNALLKCGDTGRAVFTDSLALQCAVACFSAGKQCTNANLPVKAQGDKTSIQAYYGDYMDDWCTGEVTSFANVFRSLLVSARAYPAALFRWILTLVHNFRPLTNRSEIGTPRVLPVCIMHSLGLRHLINPLVIGRLPK